MISPDPETFFDADGWRICPPASLRGHIVNDHLDPTNLNLFGIPEHDIRIAACRGIGLGWVAKNAIQILALPDDELDEVIAKDSGSGLTVIPPDEYRINLVKCLRRIDDFNLADTPWSVVEEIVPGARTVQIDPKDIKDTFVLSNIPELQGDPSSFAAVPILRPEELIVRLH